MLRHSLEHWNEFPLYLSESSGKICEAAVSFVRHPMNLGLAKTPLEYA